MWDKRQFDQGLFQQAAYHEQGQQAAETGHKNQPDQLIKCQPRQPNCQQDQIAEPHFFRTDHDEHYAENNENHKLLPAEVMAQLKLPKP